MLESFLSKNIVINSNGGLVELKTRRNDQFAQTAWRLLLARMRSASAFADQISGEVRRSGTQRGKSSRVSTADVDRSLFYVWFYTCAIYNVGFHDVGLKHSEWQNIGSLIELLLVKDTSDSSDWANRDDSTSKRLHVSLHQFSTSRVCTRGTHFGQVASSRGEAPKRKS